MGLDPQLFGGLMTALRSFSQSISGEGLSSFDYAGRRFIIIIKKSLLFIATADENIKTKKINQELNNIIKKFFSLYTIEFLNNWNGNITKFRDFKKEIDNSLEDPIKKLQKAF
jgi:hypothetical protein